MPIANLHAASLSFHLRVIDAVAMSEHQELVMGRFAEFILAYDGDLSKGQAWLNVPFKAHHDWAKNLAHGGGQYDPAAFRLAYAKVCSEVFFLDTVAPVSGVPHPAPGAWAASSLRAQPMTPLASWYVWEFDSNTGKWVRQCYADFDVIDPSGDANISPIIEIGGVIVATIGVRLAYGDAEGLTQ